MAIDKAVSMLATMAEVDMTVDTSMEGGKKKKTEVEAEVKAVSYYHQGF